MSIWQRFINWIKSFFESKTKTPPSLPVVPPIPVDPPVIQEPPTEILPKWYQIAVKELGQKEIEGREDNPRIVEYQKVLGFGDEYDSDSNVAWCMCFVAWCLWKAGKSIKGLNGLASSGDHYGISVMSDPPIGCIVTIRHADGHRHVTFFAGWNDPNKNEMIGLGGNQQNCVKYSVYPAAHIVAMRMPIANS